MQELEVACFCCIAASCADVTSSNNACPDAIAWAVVLPVVVQEDDMTCCCSRANSASVTVVAMAHLVL